MFLAICCGVGNDIVVTKDNGFSISTLGVQEIKFFKLPILTSSEDEIEQPVIINLPKSNEN